MDKGIRKIRKREWVVCFSLYCKLKILKKRSGKERAFFICAQHFPSSQNKSKGEDENDMHEQLNSFALITYQTKTCSNYYKIFVFTFPSFLLNTRNGK